MGWAASAAGWSWPRRPPTVTVMIAMMKIQDRWSRISMPKIRATGTPLIAQPQGWQVRPSTADGAACGPARRPATVAMMSASTTISAPTAIVVSDQNANGKSWTSRSVAGSNVYEPPAKNSRWNTSNAASNANERDHRRDNNTDGQAAAPFRIAAHARSA